MIPCAEPNAFSKNTIVIIGGGLAGLISSILLVREGFEVIVVEKRKYPFHRVCGEYLSKEVLPFFESIDIKISDLAPAQISRFTLSSLSGKLFSDKLDLGGLGISRYTLDNFLYQKALTEGVKFVTGKAISITQNDEIFSTLLADNSIITSAFVIAAYGKRSNLDKNRRFFQRRSPFLGVKYHIRTNFPKDLIQLDNFEGGYCGTVKIEGDRFNLCYLSRNNHLKKYGSIKAMEEAVLFKNPHLRRIFTESEFIYPKPEVINEISFEEKTLVENHILYCGDSAGMISPLCGNGMAMAIHSAKILATTISEYRNCNRFILEEAYIHSWKKHFAQRLQAGRLTQKLFGGRLVSELAVKGLNNIKPLSNFIIKQTHGIPF